MKLVNLTPHQIVIDIDGNRVTIPSTGNCRVAVKQTKEEPLSFHVLNGEGKEEYTCPIFKNIFGEVEGLPAPEAGIVYIVSLIVLNALGYRADVVAPDTGPSAIRESGQIVAVKQFIRG